MKTFDINVEISGEYTVDDNVQLEDIVELLTMDENIVLNSDRFKVVHRELNAWEGDSETTKS